MKHKLNISGLVEKNNKTFLLLDLDQKRTKDYSSLIRKQRSYKDNNFLRYLSLIETEVKEYPKLKETISAQIKKIKQKRIKKLKSVAYRLGDEDIYMNLRSSVIENFLKNDKFLKFIKKNTKQNKNILNFITEKEIKKTLFDKKIRLFKKLMKIKKKLYNNDKKWISFLKKNKLSLAVMLPTYNEVNLEKNIQIVHKLKKIGLFNELIISDGYSTQHEPSEVKRKLFRRKNIDFTILRQNGMGKGAGVETAVKYALLNNHDFVIIVDSDVLPSLKRAYPDSPLNIDIEFFVRNFIFSIIKIIKEKGIKESKKVFFKASYMRMPQLKKAMQLRFGLATTIVKDFYKRYMHSDKNLYPLSGEVVFNPKNFLEKLNLNKNMLKLMKIPHLQYCGANVPSGFTLENFWNSMIDVNNYPVYYVNMYTHHHGPVIKSSKRSIEDQRGEVMTGAIAGILTALINKKKVRRLFSKIPSDIIRAERVILELSTVTKDKKMVIEKYKISK